MLNYFSSSPSDVEKTLPAKNVPIQYVPPQLRPQYTHKCVVSGVHRRKAKRL